MYLLTLTLPHERSDSLKNLKQSVADTWRFVQTGAPWERQKAALGIVGTVRALEITVGVNGWHPHLHILILCARPFDPGVASDAAITDRFAAFVFDRWSARIVRHGWRPPTRERGISFLPSHRDDYIAKMGLANEVAAGALKRARGEGSRTPFQVLHNVTQALSRADHLGRPALARDCALWLEWSAAMKGARQLTWSKGVRERFALPEAPSDEQLAADTEAASEIVCDIHPDFWDWVARGNVALQLQLLEAAERGGAEAVERMIGLTRWPSRGSLQ